MVITMYKDIKYAPQMSQRKLAKSNMTTITEANLGKVMGDFNRFFAHDNIYQLRGFRYEVIGHEEHVMPDGYKYTTEIEGDRQVPIYHPIPKVHCKIHSLWTDYLKKKPQYQDPNEIPRLAIISIYQAHCNPVEIGDRYKIFGNRLVIYKKWDKYVHHTPWLRYSEYIQVPEVDQKAYLQMQINGLHEGMSDEMYYIHESLFGRISSNYDEEDVTSIINNFHEEVCNFAEREIRHFNGLNEWKELVLRDQSLDDDKERTITFRFNPYLFLTYGWDGKDRFCEYTNYDPECPDATTTSCIHAVVGTCQDWINAQNAEYAERHKNDPEPDYDSDDPFDWF